MSKTILCADDSKTMQRVAEITFRATDYEYVGAQSVDEALEKAKQSKPMVILADAVMPGKTGYDLCLAVKSDPALADVPVVMMCGNSASYDSSKGGMVGVDDHIIKPWDTQVLLDKVDELLQRVAGGGVARPSGVPTGIADPSDSGRVATITGMPAVQRVPGTPTPTPSTPPVAATPPAPGPAPRATPRAATPVPPKPIVPAAPPRPPVAPAPPKAPVVPRAPAMPKAPAPPSTGTAPLSALKPKAPRAPAGPKAAPRAAASKPGTLPGAGPTAPLPGPGGMQDEAGVAPASSATGTPAAIAALLANAQSAQPAAAAPAPAPTPAAPPAPAPKIGRPPMIAGTPTRRPPFEPRPLSPQARQRIATAASQAAQQVGVAADSPEMKALLALSQNVIERIVWEVVPDLAEAIIRENLDQFRG